MTGKSTAQMYNELKPLATDTEDVKRTLEAIDRVRGSSVIADALGKEILTYGRDQIRVTTRRDSCGV